MRLKYVPVIAMGGLLIAHAQTQASEEERLSKPIVFSAADDQGFKPSIKSKEGALSSSRPAATSEVPAGIWKAPPGRYEHAGHDGKIETFVVIEGTGTIEFPKAGKFELKPGVVVAIPKNTPSVLTVSETLRKFAIVTAAK
jgi:uncharacterized cupin superfamily protein